MCCEGNKHGYNKCARKVPGASVFGSNERLVLSYAIMSRRFTVSDVVVYFRSLGRVLSNRRIWDSVQRLVRRGFLRKVARGLYELAKDIDVSVLGLADKENLCHCVGCGWGFSSSSRVGGGVVRVHGNGRGVVDYFRRVYFAFKLLGCVVRRLEATLRGLGLSRSYIRRVKSEISSVVDVICYADGVVGCHGRYGAGRRFSGLKPLSLCVGHYYEYGVDIDVGELASAVVDVVGGKPFVKIYLRAS